MRYDYRSLLPRAPEMSSDSPTRNTNMLDSSNVSPKTSLNLSPKRAESTVTLGEHSKADKTQQDSFVTAVAQAGGMHRTFDDSITSDGRLKPTSLRRHKNSEYQQYLPKHALGSPNLIAAPYPTDEKGRLKKTQVLDHIINMKKGISRKNEKILEEKKNKNEETFITYLLEKRANEKAEKRKMRLQRASQANFGSITGLNSTVNQSLEQAAPGTADKAAA